MSLVLLLYDTLITLDREINWFWSGRITGASILLFTNRYISLAWIVLGFIQLMSFSDKASRQALSMV